MSHETDSHDLLERIEHLEEGDVIEVTTQFAYQDPEEHIVIVTNVTKGPRPLVDLKFFAEDERTDGTLALEYDEYYSDGTPYNLRYLMSEKDGASVTNVVRIEDPPKSEVAV